MKKYLYLLVPTIFLLIFIVFTIMAKTVDVHYEAIGNFKIGFHHFNYEVGEWVVKQNRMSSTKKISDLLLYVGIGISGIFALIGIYQWIRRKSLLKVDYRLYLLAATYVFIAIAYLLFEIIKVNYSPDLTEGLKCSYPSSHVFIGCSLFIVNIYTALEMLNLAEDKSWLKYIGYLATAVICVGIIYTRLLTLKHWVTDIIGAILLILFISSLYIALFNKFFKVKKEEQVDGEIE